MPRQLTETEIALFRFGYWPCCGERATIGHEPEPIIRTLTCERCGTVAKIPRFVTTAEMMKRLSVMIHQPAVDYDPPAVADRHNVNPRQVILANQLMDLAPHEARQQRRRLWWMTIPPEVKWNVAIVLVTVAGAVTAFQLWPGTVFDQYRVAIRILGGGMVVMFAGLALMSWRRSRRGN